ncbi:MAG: hypothetical protein IH855_10210 [Bacteroidetes bacterium]|nr:hypothetical protein [Bacteroidota bacterium]
MTPKSIDTPLAVERILVEGYRAMSPAQKIQRVVALNRALDELAMVRTRAHHGPELPLMEAKLRLASVHLDGDTMHRVFDWDPDVEGF